MKALKCESCVAWMMSGDYEKGFCEGVGREYTFPHVLPPSPHCVLRALTRNSQVPRGKQQEAEDAMSVLNNAASVFTKAALVYAMQMNEVELKKGFEIQDKVQMLI